MAEPFNGNHAHARAYSSPNRLSLTINKCPPTQNHNKISISKMSGVKDQLGLDLDYTLKSLQTSIQSTSELLLNLPESLNGTVTEDEAAR